jgi:cytoskeletal protein CcmA (bactofilin family)
MREERGQIAGDVVVYERFTLWGSVGGNVSVVVGGKFYQRGAIYGNMTVEDGGRVHIYGNVSGNVIVKSGAKLIHSGMIGGDLTNEGGRLYIDRAATVLGRVKTISGKTEFENKQTWLGGKGDETNTKKRVKE